MHTQFRCSCNREYSRKKQQNSQLSLSILGLTSFGRWQTCNPFPGQSPTCFFIFLLFLHFKKKVGHRNSKAMAFRTKTITIAYKLMILPKVQLLPSRGKISSISFILLKKVVLRAVNRK